MQVKQSMATDLQTRLAALRLSRGFRNLARRSLARGFSGKARKRVVIYHMPNRISYAQVYPFVHYQKALWDRFQAEVRCVPFETLLTQRPTAHQDADIVLIQPWFTISAEDLHTACAAVARHHPHAAMSFLDSYAHSDIRLARHLPQSLAFYIKKSLHVDRATYLQGYRADTLMMEYYADLHGIAAESVDFQTPPEILKKLRLAPNFLTAPHFIRGFQPKGPPPMANRPLDIQTRLGQSGQFTYGAMRRGALAAVHALEGVGRSADGPLPYKAYMNEMRQAKLCFSPFGYGELCWRDIEAIQAGSVMIKQDMSHLETCPDLYEAGVTYLPVAWDFSNLEDVVRSALADPEMCSRIATTAWQRVKTYLDDAQFVSDMAFLFEN